MRDIRLFPPKPPARLTNTRHPSLRWGDGCWFGGMGRVAEAETAIASATIPSIIPPQKPCQFALNTHLLRVVDLRFVGAVGGVEADAGAVFAEIF